MFITDENDLETAHPSKRDKYDLGNKNRKNSKTRIIDHTNGGEETTPAALGEITNLEQVKRWNELVTKNNNADDLISVKDESEL
tara:strand:+ start:790 stop:1041 length:252 start_codon:yes stop_codon:yes gene_type:complete